MVLEYINYLWLSFIPVVFQITALTYLMMVRKAIGWKFTTLFLVKNGTMLLLDIILIYGIIFENPDSEAETMSSQVLVFFLLYVVPFVMGTANLLAQRLVYILYKHVVNKPPDPKRDIDRDLARDAERDTTRDVERDSDRDRERDLRRDIYHKKEEDEAKVEAKEEGKVEARQELADAASEAKVELEDARVEARQELADARTQQQEEDSSNNNNNK